jgi:isoquinoline 1-oxidoreductase beta subunit
VKDETHTVKAKSRRRFLKAGAVVVPGLVIGFYLPERRVALALQTMEQPAVFAPNAFLRIGANNIVTVISKHIEVGQGVYTGLATIVAEELDAAWSQVRVEPAPADDNLYRNLRLGMQATCCSNSILNSFEQYRQAGAMARAMLVAAAAKRWQVPANEIAVEKGVVKHLRSSQQAAFGDLAPLAATVPPPGHVTLKDPQDYSLIGAPHLPRVDSKAKVNGSALFPIDVSLPEMVIVSVERPPRFGALLKRFDPAAARSVQGVIEVVPVSDGVAVVAKSFPAAQQGRKALQIEWDESKCESRGTPELLSEYRTLLDQPGAVARRDGDAATALAGAARTLTATYEFPYLAHVPMEPDSAVVRLSADRCDIWAYDAAPASLQNRAARITGLRREQVQVHSLYGGGSYGGGGGGADIAVEVAHATGGHFPVKLLDTREDMMRTDRYRPMYIHKLTAGLDEHGNLIAWHHRIVGQSIFAGQPGYVTNGVDITSVGGASNIPYNIPNILVDLHSTASRIPIATWRSVGDSHTAFAVETFLDDIAHAAGRDPLQIRRDLLARDPREKPILEFAADPRFRDTTFAKFPRDRQVLELAAAKADWVTPLPAGKGRGIAVHYSFRTSLAHVAEVTVGPNGGVKVDRVVCAIDCGLAINPDIIRAQVEGGVAFGLSSILHERITVKAGAVEQSNFHDYPVLRISEMPRVEVHIAPSGEPPTGIGEPVVPSVGPAVSNAIFAATGKRVRTLPLSPVT